MSKTAWTPGPWVAVPAGQYAGGVEIEASGNPLVVQGRSERAKANRRLIAEAPAMAEALGALEAALDEAHSALNGAPYTVGVDCQITHALSEARAILARINGEAGR